MFLLVLCAIDDAGARCFVQSFVYDNNLYYQASPAVRPVQVTTSGDLLYVFNGVPDWLYEGYWQHYSICYHYCYYYYYYCYRITAIKQHNP